jgi:hypothetical protein
MEPSLLSKKTEILVLWSVLERKICGKAEDGLSNLYSLLKGSFCARCQTLQPRHGRLLYYTKLEIHGERVEGCVSQNRNSANQFSSSQIIVLSSSMRSETFAASRKLNSAILKQAVKERMLMFSRLFRRSKKKDQELGETLIRNSSLPSKEPFLHLFLDWT